MKKDAKQPDLFTVKNFSKKRDPSYSFSRKNHNHDKEPHSSQVDAILKIFKGQIVESVNEETFRYNVA